jgi:hypothetical protein
MATSREYFEKNLHFEFGSDFTFNTTDGQVVVSVKVPYDFEGGAKHLKLYVPECPYPDKVVDAVAANLKAIWEKSAGVGVQMGFAGTTEMVDSAELSFSGRLLVYTPCTIQDERWSSLKESLGARGLKLLVRDGEYTKARSSHEFPRAFISHDSRDKAALVSELASKLSQMMCPVWYDEYKLVPGQSLRESIEAGLKTCPKCIVVLSKNFFENPGWTKREFDTVYTREIIEGNRVMIPIWLGVTRQEVYNYSPILADNVGINAGLGVDEVARKLYSVLMN